MKFMRIFGIVLVTLPILVSCSKSMKLLPGKKPLEVSVIQNKEIVDNRGN